MANVNLQAECLNLQNIIADLIHLKGEELTPDEEIALFHARRWLGNITTPLTAQEQEQWGEESSAYCEEIIRDADTQYVYDRLNDADRRDALEYLREVE
jgi:hypothetical protein